MTEQQKKRVIGALALLVVGLVVLPLLLDGAGYRERHLQSRIPAPPAALGAIDVQPQQQALPDTLVPAVPGEPAVVNVPVEALQQTIQQSAPSIEPQPDTPTLDQEQVPVAWSLQLASFRDEANARALRNELTKAGYKVYIRHVTGLVKVFVGPELQRTRLEALQGRLKQEYALDGIVVRFTTQ